MDDRAELVFCRDSEEDMGVIRHHHEGCDGVTLAIEMMKRIAHDFSGGGIAEATGAVAIVQNFLEAEGEEAVVLFLCFLVPRLRVVDFPSFLLTEDFLDHVLG